MMRFKFLPIALLCAAALIAPAAIAEEEAKPAEPQGPNIDKVLEELSKIGPEALVARVNELKAQVAAKEKEATDAQAAADAKKAEVAALKAKIATIENFTKAVTAAMAPPAEQPKAEAPPAEAKPAEAEKADG